MALAIGRKADHVRVLSDLSRLVVGALVDDERRASESDPFADALRRYQEDGAPDLKASWRAVEPAAGGAYAVEVLRHLTRDLLKDVSTPPSETHDDAARAPELPTNVRPMDAAPRDIPALELATDGTWRPSGAAISAQEDTDARALRRNLPAARSRYPEVAPEGRVMLPPAPKRFTEVTAPAPATAPIPVTTPAATTPDVSAPAPEARAVVEDAVTVAPAPPVPAPVIVTPPPPVESVIKQVAAGTEVVAGPFAHFKQLASFVKALRDVDGVHDVTTRQFVRGMVHLRVRHAHGTTLADRLLELTDFSPEVVSSTQDRVELTVAPAE